MESLVFWWDGGCNEFGLVVGGNWILMQRGREY